MLISFSKAWGQDGYKWNYSGGDYNFRTMADFMDFYGIKSAWITGKEIYFEEENEIECNEYSGYATKEVERLKKHWYIQYCNPCLYLNSTILTNNSREA